MSRPRLPVFGSKWNKCHEVNYLLSAHHLHRPSNDMGLRDFLSLPKGHRRSRSKARSEIGSIEGQGEADLVAHQRPAESTPDLRIGSSTSPTSNPLTSRDRESNSTRAPSPRMIYLTALYSRNVDRSSISDRFRSVFSKSKPLASSTAKLLLRGVKESADAFPPLKSVAGGLCFILDNCEVRPTRTSPDLRCSRSSQKTMACRQTIESLIPRVEALAQSLGSPVPEGEFKEEERRKILER